MAGSLGWGNRLRYLVKRARAIDTANLRRLAGLIAASSGRPRLFITLDMLWAAVRHETAFQDYFDWDFHTLTSRERRTFITHPKSNHLALRLNAVEHRSTFANKALFNVRFAPYLGREWIDVRTANDDELSAFLARHSRVIAKVADSLGGDGIEAFTSADVSEVAAFRAARIANRQVLLEEFLTQHPEMSRLNDSSVNTLRIVTYLDDAGTVHTLARVLKMGNGGDVDNFSDGGMYTMLDADGVAHYAAFDGAGGVYTVHPRSGTSIVGFAVPQWDAVQALVEKLAREVPDIRYVGWDVAITPSGAAVIEGNYNTGVFQLKPSATGVREGLLPVYRAAIGF
ncbi:sugar-transfer associated ATP-grasp domain-containing protein [Microcella sp.]|uniref:sugar-transfer associated ATP-grasp domain-containing protein n=1 Tax=Microcella sp. TaxID=1913979 RepID=UPI00299F55BE|nr:sugar-transfer associated ATP-grasp domain-containing protein [Microcella sp.]MDX2026321.1 sugar-transfer associated ATP-grasp domain-containing protein [Microcella sp.]